MNYFALVQWCQRLKGVRFVFSSPVGQRYRWDMGIWKEPWMMTQYSCTGIEAVVVVFSSSSDISSSPLTECCVLLLWCAWCRLPLISMHGSLLWMRTASSHDTYSCLWTFARTFIITWCALAWVRLNYSPAACVSTALCFQLSSVPHLNTETPRCFPLQQ